VANRPPAVRDKVKEAVADKGNRVANQVAENKVGNRAESKTANFRSQREMRFGLISRCFFAFS
jgi:hypothetical protein